jgi:para-aminobenzoate synthetase component 1
MSRYPLIEEISSAASPPSVFQLFHDKPNSCFLDSGMDPQRLGRYSFIGTDPFLIMTSSGNEINLVEHESHKIEQGNPFNVLGRFLETYKLDAQQAPVPFLGGAIGYLSYDLCHFIERLPLSTEDDLNFPESYFAFYDTIIAFDNLENKAYIISTGFPELNEDKRAKRARQRLNSIKKKLGSRAIHIPQDNPRFNPDTEAVLKSNFTHEDYIKAIEKARDYIIAGDIFQVNISQRFQTELTMPPYELYQRLRRINPAPFSAYLNFDGITIISASPERFLRVDEDSVETRPIKGTRPRGENPEQDARLAQELLSSIKDKAENVMIVDLERNDLGRVCQYGSVVVTELAILETFPTVFHLTSTVTGKLKPGISRVDLLKATFPGGSITGAPKVRSMEIIDELEPTRRSVYTGAIGYLSFSNNLDLNIVIRTFLIKGQKAYFQAGGGIVYDSDPQAEYEETLHKVKALLQALQLTSKLAVKIQ